MTVPETSPSRDDVAAALAARRELGDEYDDALVGGFLDRLERTIDARVKSQVDQRQEARKELADRDNFSLKLGSARSRSASPSPRSQGTKASPALLSPGAGSP